ncbi:hypothetical protein C8J56DRAFT_891738 [Mycena floridula]|nr:hypothetical protein C8J56DRAFT_891738 [Mycena floridula]
MLCAKFILTAFSAFITVSVAPGAGALRRQSEFRIFLLDEHGIKMDASSAESKVSRLTIWMLKKPITLFAMSNFSSGIWIDRQMSVPISGQDTVRLLDKHWH